MSPSRISDFAYVGGRPYIRGVDVLRFFLENHAVSMSDPPYEVRSLKLIRELQRNGVWEVADESTGIDNASLTPSATLEYTDSRKNRHQALFFETSALITRELPDASPIVSSIVCGSPFAGCATIAPPLTAISLLDGLVTANKAIHATTLQERGKHAGSIRFVYVEGFPLSVAPQSNPADLKIIHRGSREKDGRVYTLNVADFVMNSGSFKALICFSYQSELETP
jgi:hypothetical protein